MNPQQRQVSLFRNGRNQAVRIPREFELTGSEAIMKKDGNRLIIEPLEHPKLATILSQLPPLNETFPDVDNDLPSLDEPDI